MARPLRIQFEGAVYHVPRMHVRRSSKRYLKRSDCDAHIHEPVRLHHYKLQEVGDDLGLHFSIIRAISQATSHWEYRPKL
jgi:hypothetical protein